jgi:hypothetical protein
MGRADYYNDGNWNAICDECGKKFKFSQLKKRWDGLFVCEREWEPRHPQDFVKGIRDNMSVPISRPEASNLYTIITSSVKLVDGYSVDTFTLG